MAPRHGSAAVTHRPRSASSVNGSRGTHSAAPTEPRMHAWYTDPICAAIEGAALSPSLFQRMTSHEDSFSMLGPFGAKISSCIQRGRGAERMRPPLSAMPAISGALWRAPRELQPSPSGAAPVKLRAQQQQTRTSAAPHEMLNTGLSRSPLARQDLH